MTPIEKLAYLSHTKTKAFKNKVQTAKELIAKNPDFAISASWGKDSTVMLHLACTVLSPLVINIRYPHWAERIADQDRVRDDFLNRPDAQSIRYHEEISPGLWDTFERFGLMIEHDDKVNRQATKWFDDNFNNAFLKAESITGAKGYFVGMRADESQRRAKNIKMRGKEYTRKDGRNMVLPLAGWNGQDIWAYIAAHDLPYLKIYDKAQNRDRQRSEIAMSSTMSAMLQANGEWALWREHYPDEYRAWMERWPELKKSAKF